MNRSSRFVLVGIVVLICAVAIMLIVRRGGPSRTTVPLPSTPVSESPQVGPLQIAPASLLIVTTPDFHVEIDSQGVGAIVRAVANTAPAEAAQKQDFVLPAEAGERLMADLGRIKAAWSTREVGEDAVVETGAAASPSDTPSIDQSVITVEERSTDGSMRLLIRMISSSPEYEDLQKALTPLRLIP